MVQYFNDNIVKKKLFYATLNIQIGIIRTNETYQ